MVTLRDAARSFWCGSRSYPSFPHAEDRRWAERNYLLRHLGAKTVRSVVDIGCGDGSLLAWLASENPAASLVGIDQNQWRAMGVPVDVRDVFSDEPYPVAELAVAAGVLPYAFDDAMVSQFVKNLRSEKVYIRLPCSVGAERATASGHSAALGREYAARYHAVEDILVPLRERYDIERIDRVYPDDIESEFGTKQFAIVGSLR